VTARAQSSVVGVALLLALTVASMAVLTVGVGSVIDGAATGAQADRVADRFVTLLPGGHPAGARSGSLRLAGGDLATLDRQVRVLAGGSVVLERDADALVYRVGDRRVAALAGTVVTGPPGAATFVRDPQLSVAAAVTYLAVPVVTTTPDRAVTSPVTLAVDVEATATRTTLSPARYRVAIETATPGPWRRWFADRGLETVTRDLDGDGVDSVVATLPATRLEVVVIATEVRVHA